MGASIGLVLRGGSGGAGEVGLGDRADVRSALYARGAGIKVNGRPDRTALKGFFAAFELKLRPRKAGTLRAWATIDGVRTNALKIAAARGC